MSELTVVDGLLYRFSSKLTLQEAVAYLGDLAYVPDSLIPIYSSDHSQLGYRSLGILLEKFSWKDLVLTLKDKGILSCVSTDSNSFLTALTLGLAAYIAQHPRDLFSISNPTEIIGIGFWFWEVLGQYHRSEANDLMELMGANLPAEFAYDFLKRLIKDGHPAAEAIARGLINKVGTISLAMLHQIIVTAGPDSPLTRRFAEVLQGLLTINSKLSAPNQEQLIERRRLFNQLTILIGEEEAMNWASRELSSQVLPDNI